MTLKQTVIPLAVAALTLSVTAPLLAQNRTYKVLATSKTSTMQKEMQESGDAGYRFVAVMGGETAVGGKEVVVLMEKSDEHPGPYSYRLLATNKTSTLQKELQEAADAGFAVVGQTVFESAFGGKETAAILQKGVNGGVRPLRVQAGCDVEDVDDGKRASRAGGCRIRGHWSHSRQDRHRGQ